MKDKWIEQFQGKMDGYEMAAPEMPWAELDKALADNRRAGMRIVWGRRIAAAAAIALLIAGGSRILFNGHDDISQKDIPTLSAKAQENINASDNMPTASEGLLAEVSQAAAHKAAAIRHEMEDLGIAVAETSAPVETTNEVAANEVTAKEERQPATPRQAEKATCKRTYTYNKKVTPRNRMTDSRLMAAVYMQNAMVNNGSNLVNQAMNSEPVTKRPYGSASDEFMNGTLDFIAESNPKDVHYDHDRPIKVGVSVKYSLNDRWSVSSGLTYSYLRSDFDYSEGKAFGSGVQKLHYLGLPLAASYNVVKGKRFNVYLTAGGEMQKLVSGKAVVDGVNMKEEDKRHDVREGGMQWSLNAAVGAEYNFTDNLGVYLEPGVSHYIDNNSSVENFYKHKPTNFSLNVGLRLNIR